MKGCSLFVATLVLTGLCLLFGHIAEAATPTPTETATSTPIPMPPSTPSAEQLSVFIGQSYVDARHSCAPVSARIGGTICGTTQQLSPAGSGGCGFRLEVPSAQVVPGCGYEGAVVEFLVGDQLASPTAVWHASTQLQFGFQVAYPIVGPPFALFGGPTEANRFANRETILPYVGEQTCGYFVSGWTTGVYAFSIGVYSAERQPGCGVEGAEITFKLLDAQGNVLGVAREKGIWRSWRGPEDARSVQLTFGAGNGGGATIRVGRVGTGGPASAGFPWGEAAVALAVAGFAATAAAVALRRRVLR